MSNLHTINGKPVAAASGAEEKVTPRATTSIPPTVSEKKQTHKAECGDVGATGEHGDLGSNAA
jgi:hypothetical protein